MKKAIIASVFLLIGLNVQAEDMERSYIQVYNASLCNYWSYMSSSSIGSTSGYVCSGYPTTASIPEAHSVQSAIDQLENKIRTLEAKVSALEAKIAR